MAYGNKYSVSIISIAYCVLRITSLCFAQDLKQPNVAGAFYPDNPKELSEKIDAFLEHADPEPVKGEIFALIAPHAGYDFSGKVAAYGYKLIRNKPYRTVIILAPSHYHKFEGASVYKKGIFVTPLGNLEIDSEFTAQLLNKESGIFFDAGVFKKEHSLEVQLPFLQKVLSDFKIVPVIIGNYTLENCQKLAVLLKEVIGSRKDVLVVASTDMYHGYDFQAAASIDQLTLSYITKMDIEGLYAGLESNRLQLCGGLPVVTAMLLARSLGHDQVKVLEYTDSSIVTGRKIKGEWTVGYSSCAIDQAKEGENGMLNTSQRKKLLEIARNSIEAYLKSGRKLELKESDPLLLKEMGAFVTLHKGEELRGCIGSLIGNQPFYLTIRDMAIESATEDPRFPAVTLNELKDLTIEISLLTPLERVYSADEIKLGVHGVLVRKGFKSGVFLPQVAEETGWNKEEFLSYLCLHKAGLPVDAWKDKSTEIYIFTAEVFSEKELK